MKKLSKFRLLGFLVLVALACSCSNELHMFLPEGPKGDNGLSAHELWLQEIDKGTIVWTGGKDIAGFFLYLKGQDGQDGQNGQDGQDGQNGKDGKSAYELWIEEVAKGIDNPHSPGTEWDKSKNSQQDFWDYLTGADGGDGLSAYELWKIEVDKGLEDPHNLGHNWDKNKTELADFWEYLRGENGSTIILGSPNVIIDTFGGVEGEYVSPQNGSVTYTVYDKGGNRAKPGTEVKNMPATLNNQIYTVDANGKIKVPKEDLPLDATINQRFGTCEVKFTGESEWYVSAANTLVPNRVQVKLYTVTYRNPVLVYQGWITLRVQIQRKTSDSGNWGFTPSTLYNYAGTSIKTYQLSGKEVDPAIDIPANGLSIQSDNRNFADAGASYDIGFTMFNRDAIETGATWSGVQAYFGIAATAYGETIYAESVIDRYTPIQKVPMIADVKAQKVGESLYRISARFQTETVNDDYLYAGGYNYSSINTLGKPYLSVQVDGNAKNTKCMILKFIKGSGSDQTTITCNPVSINDGGLSKTDVGGGVPVGSTIQLECDNHLFATRGSIGVLNTDGASGLVINLSGGGTIPVTIVPSID